MGSAVRSILRNPLYVGAVHWNRVQWSKDPDTGKRHKKTRPEAEWITHKDESLRIIDQNVWDRVQLRMRAHEKAGAGRPKHSGGGSSHVLSGLLICAECGRPYVMSGKYSYACASHVGGKARDNNTRVNRKLVEGKFLGPINDQLLSPAVIKIIVSEMQKRLPQRQACTGERTRHRAEGARRARGADCQITGATGQGRSRHDGGRDCGRD
jgi:hypothetical protein